MPEISAKIFKFQVQKLKQHYSKNYSRLFGEIKCVRTAPDKERPKRAQKKSCFGNQIASRQFFPKLRG